MKKSGWWDENTQNFANGVPETYDLYGSWALSLGSDPVKKDTDVKKLSSAIVPLRDQC